MKAILSKKIVLIFFLTIVLLFMYTSLRDIKKHVLTSYGINENFVEEVVNTEMEKDQYEMRIISEDDADKNQKIVKDTAEMKYILQWTSSKNVPFVYMGEGQKGFIDRKCPNVNCFVTANKTLLGDYTKFDVIAFSGPEVIRMFNSILPEKRSPHQKYTFASIESSDYYPVCSNRFDNYFNWTWTFRLDSEVRWGYMIVRDKENNIVGPNKVMHWIKHEDMDPVDEELKGQLKTKTKAAAWFVSNCHSKGRREDFVRNLQKELEIYDLTVDVYGTCGPLKCGREKEDECDKLIKQKYYFYLSFENSFSEDYVTEKLLRALENDAVPIVYGAANYTRFMSNNMYINGRDLGVASLAAKMHELINNPEQYYEYFRWKNHYSYHRKSDSVETDEYCLFCSTLNDDIMVKNENVYHNFREWWDPPNRC